LHGRDETVGLAPCVSGFVVGGRYEVLEEHFPVAPEQSADDGVFLVDVEVGQVDAFVPVRQELIQPPRPPVDAQQKFLHGSLALCRAARRQRGAWRTSWGRWTRRAPAGEGRAPASSGRRGRRAKLPKRGPFAVHPLLLDL